MSYLLYIWQKIIHTAVLLFCLICCRMSHWFYVIKKTVVPPLCYFDDFFLRAHSRKSKCFRNPPRNDHTSLFDAPYRPTAQFDIAKVTFSSSHYASRRDLIIAPWTGTHIHKYPAARLVVISASSRAFSAYDAPTPRSIISPSSLVESLVAGTTNRNRNPHLGREHRLVSQPVAALCFFRWGKGCCPKWSNRWPKGLRTWPRQQVN